MNEFENIKKAVFVDKDGTLIPNIPYNVDPEKITIDGETIEGLRLLKQEGFLLIVISNQSGVAKGYFEEKDLVVISKGVFMDKEGVVVKGGKRRVYVRLESLDQVMTVEFPAEHLQHKLTHYYHNS